VRSAKPLPAVRAVRHAEEKAAANQGPAPSAEQRRPSPLKPVNGDASKLLQPPGAIIPDPG